MKNNILAKSSIILALCILFIGLNTLTSWGQSNAKSTFHLGKLLDQKDPIPGEGSLKGEVVVLGKKTKVPLAFVEVDGGRSIQANQKGKFNLVLEHGTYKIKISCSGYKDLVIETIAVQEGTDQIIKIELAIREKGNFK